MILQEYQIHTRYPCGDVRIWSVTTPIHPVGVVTADKGSKLRSTTTL